MLQVTHPMNTLFKKVQIALTPRDWLLKAKLANGAVVYGKNRAGFGGRGIYLYQDAIEPEFEHLEKFLEPQGTFIDVGANTGIYTIKAAKYYGSEGTVIAIEPFPDVLATLFHSIRANKFNNVRLRNFCAGEKTSSAKLWLNDGHPNSFSLLKHEEGASCLSTLTVALDDLFAWEGLNRLDFLKIDAEGAEQQVLAGASKILEKYRPIIQMEVILNEVSFSLPSYSVFRAPGSPNKLYIPNESSKIGVPKQLGWEQI
ncbi:MAG: FkbM family methyltransferase [Hydrococcus sp. Prado102]|jgi:FkbM family methyltransferase|nr:FkbM family methyltransferase [Hydrococcus sp. Prado102]